VQSGNRLNKFFVNKFGCRSGEYAIFFLSLFWEIFLSGMETEHENGAIARYRKELDKDEATFFTMNFGCLLPYAW
jgi:hypothetical protein